jgi:hypothetical protein
MLPTETSDHVTRRPNRTLATGDIDLAASSQSLSDDVTEPANQVLGTSNVDLDTYHRN